MPGETEITTVPCARCGGTAIIHEQKMLPSEDHDWEFIACCDTCIQRGEWSRFRYEAIESWNEKNKPRG